MPKVFLDYTQAQLDQAYDQLVWAPPRSPCGSRPGWHRAHPPRTERYGTSEMQVLDIYAPKAAAGAPVLVYLHGGAWLRGSRLDVAYPAPALIGRGAALVVPDFDNVAAVGLPAMIEQGKGVIVNMASIGGVVAVRERAAYCTTKFAVVGLTKSLALDHAHQGIRVNCICPGIVRSPMHEAYHRSESELQEFYAKRGATFPLGRVGESRDVAGAVRFFLGPDSAWVTGDVFVVDGGRLLL